MLDHNLVGGSEKGTKDTLATIASGGRKPHTMNGNTNLGHDQLEKKGISLVNGEGPGRPMADNEVLREVANLCHCELADLEDVYPCTPLQEGMMALTFKDSTAYTVEYEYRIPLGTNLKQFQEAWHRASQACPILRTRIVSTSKQGCLQAVLREPIHWQVQADDDGMPSPTDNVDWRAGGPLAYFTMNITRSLLTVVIHHAICDDWSMALLLRQVSAAYHGEELVPRPFRPLIQYVKQTHSRAEAFWKDAFREAQDSPMKTFPTLPTSGYVARPEGRLLRTFAIHPGIGEDFTSNTKIRLAWAILQSFYTSSSDNLFGAINVGRGVPVPGIEDLCGPALTSVPVRVQLNPQHTVAEALGDVQRKWVAAMEFEHVGLQTLLHLGPGPAAACQFQTLLAVEPRGAHSIPDLFSQHRSIQRTYDLYPFILRFRPSAETMEIEARFDPSVIEPRQAERILHQLAYIYEQMEKAPYLTLREIDPICPEDRAQLGRWNRLSAHTSAPPPCIHDLIQQRTRLQPDATAISSWDGELTYQELDDQSSEVASLLLLHGVGAGTFVPLLVEKSKWRAVAMIAVMKAGGAFVLLDSSFPIMRLQKMCHELRAVTVVASEQHANIAFQLATQVVVIDKPSATQRIQENGHCFPYSTAVTPTDPLYATFTSGSTGTPKGVVVHHAGYASSSLAHGQPYHFTPQSRVLQFASPAFDSCIIEHLSVLIAGGCVCIPSADDCKSNLAESIKRFAVDVACLTPTVTRILSPKTVPNLKVLVFVGEAVLATDIARWSPFVQVRNAYGPAECSAVFSVQPNLQQRDPCNIGCPTGGVGWVVYPEDHRRLMPLGCTGELLIEGPIVGHGYLFRPELSAQAFIEPPPWRGQFTPEPCGRLYKTGDLVQLKGDGSFSYVGRKDTQVKLHGQRLELADVEHYLHAAFPQAQQAIAELLTSDRRDGRPRTFLTAFVYIPNQTVAASSSLPSRENGSLFLPPNDDFRSTCAAAESRLSESLPTFMVPNSFLLLSRVPLTPSGKTDRRQLREQVDLLSWDEMQAYRSAREPSKLPTTAREEILRNIWAQTLNRPVDEIGISDSFFRLGGDSVSAMQVTTSCQTSGLTVTVADIFRFPTISKLAQKIQESDKKTSLSMGPDDQKDIWFGLSPIQRLFFELVPDGHNQFTQQFLLRIAKPKSDSQIQEAVQAVVSRYPMLRARFQKQTDKQWLQQISNDITNSYRFRQHRLPSIEAQEDLKKIYSDSREMLDIDQGIMMIVDLIHTPAKEKYLGLMAHHLVVDLVSWRVLLQDLEDILSTGRPTQHLSMSFQRWCRMQETHCRESLDLNQTIPVDIPPPPPGYWGAEIARSGNTWASAVQQSVSLPENATQAILGSANDAFHTRPVEIIQAAVLYAFVETFHDRSAPTIFSEGHGREPWDPKIDVSHTVGWFTTMVPLFVNAKRGEDITEVLQRTKDGRRAIPSNGWAYFTSRYLHPDGPARCQDHSPIEILFNYTGLFQQLERPGAHLQLAAVPDHDILPMPGDLPRFALIDVSATVANGCLNLTFMYNRHTKHQERLQQWIHTCLNTLEGLPSTLQRLQRLTVSDFPLLSLTSDKELQGLLHQISCQCDVSLSDIEDIYPCSPIQLGMWLSQAKRPDMYWSCMRWRISLSNSPPTSRDITRVKQAWQRVVDRHSILRTVFVEATGEHSHPVQVALRSVQADVDILSEPPQAVDGFFPSRSYSFLGNHARNGKGRAPHRLITIIEPDGGISCELLIHHMLMDGVTGKTLLSDFHQAYDKQLSSAQGSSYSTYIRYLQARDASGAGEYWKDYLQGVYPCLFPSFSVASTDVDPSTARSVNSVPYSFGNGNNLQAFCQHHGITISSLMQVAWGIVLHIYTGNESVCFGYLTSGRDIPLHNAHEIAGPLINLLICRLSFNDDTSILSTLLDNQASFAQSIEHQHFSMTDIMHSLSLSGQSLFNTAMSLQKESGDQIPAHDSSITLEEVVGYDATEVCASF